MATTFQLIGLISEKLSEITDLQIRLDEKLPEGISPLVLMDMSEAIEKFMKGLEKVRKHAVKQQRRRVAIKYGDPKPQAITG